MSGVIAAGVACTGDPLHRVRHWVVDARRVLHLEGVNKGAQVPTALRQALKLPIPGHARVLLVDPFTHAALLDDGAAWILDYYGSPMWRPANEECDRVKKANESPAYIAAGSYCGGRWAVDQDRRIWRWAAKGRAALADAPVPGTATILDVDARHGVVLLNDGSRLAWLAGRWCAHPSLFDASRSGKMRVRVVSGFSRGPTLGDANEGDVIELEEGEARTLLTQGRVEPAPAEASA